MKFHHSVLHQRINRLMRLKSLFDEVGWLGESDIGGVWSTLAEVCRSLLLPFC